MTPLIILIFIFQLFLSFKKPLLGFCLLLMVKILVPDNVRFLIGDLSLNTCCSLILFSVWILKSRLWGRRLQVDTKIIWYILGFIAMFGFTMLLTDFSVPVSYQFKPYFAYVVLQLLPIVVMIDVVRSQEDVSLLLKCLLFATAICVVYSVVCFVLNIPYPYNDMINSLFPGRDKDIEMVMSSEMGGIAGRCMGTATSGTWDYAMVVTSLFLCIGSMALFLKKKIWYVVWIICGIDVLCTTRRSPIIAAGLFMLIAFLLLDRNKVGKKLMWLTCGGAFC